MPKAPTRTPSPGNFSFVIGPGGFPIWARQHPSETNRRQGPKHQEFLAAVWGRSNVRPKRIRENGPSGWKKHFQDHSAHHETTCLQDNICSADTWWYMMIHYDTWWQILTNDDSFATSIQMMSGLVNAIPIHHQTCVTHHLPSAVVACIQRGTLTPRLQKA